MYQFYNGWEPPGLPDDNAWEEFRDHEACRVAAMSAFTWMRDGWEVRRLISANVEKGFRFTGALADMQSEKMPMEYWNFWFAVYDLAPCWVSEIDVMSAGFAPHHAFYHQCKAEKFKDSPMPGMVQTLEDYWDAGCMYVTKEACQAAYHIIWHYDEGTWPLPKCGKRILGWDALLRTQAFNCYNAKVGTYAYINNTYRNDRKVLHFPRSCLKYYLREVDSQHVKKETP